MAAKFVSERNIKFLLYEVFDLEALTHYEYYSEHTRKGFDLVLKAAVKLAKDLLYPIFEEMDRSQPELVDGGLRVHRDVRKIMREFGEGGWINSTVPFDRDGEQLPHLLSQACGYIFSAANYSASVYPGLTTGAADLIDTFGSRELYETYVPSMYAGKWQGTMALTEPEAGSSLTDLTTLAEPTDQGHYLIKGQKIFISAGDHDGVENVVHLMLAKIKGAPAGVKGISLFVVPKKRPDANGRLVPNDVTTSGHFSQAGLSGLPDRSTESGRQKRLSGVPGGAAACRPQIYVSDDEWGPHRRRHGGDRSGIRRLLCLPGICQNQAPGQACFSKRPNPAAGAHHRACRCEAHAACFSARWSKAHFHC